MWHKYLGEMKQMTTCLPGSLYLSVKSITAPTQFMFIGVTAITTTLFRSEDSRVIKLLSEPAFKEFLLAFIYRCLVD